MSSMKYTYIGTKNARILGNLKGSASTNGIPLDLKGRTQSVDEYNFTVSGRGNPQGSTTKKYFLESSKKNTMGIPPKPKYPMIGGNPFQEIKREDFEYLDDINGNKLQRIAPPSKKGISKKQLLYISACAISVLTYKYSKGNKEFKAFLGLLSPFILGYGVTRYNNYKKRKERQKDPEPNHPFGSA